MISIKVLTENILPLIYKPHRDTAIYFGKRYCENITRRVGKMQCFVNTEADIT